MAEITRRDFIPFTERPSEDSRFGTGEVGHLCQAIYDAWRLEHEDEFEAARFFESDPHLEDHARLALDALGVAPVYIGIGSVEGKPRVFVLHEDGVDLVRPRLELKQERGGWFLRGLERWMLPPRTISYTEAIWDFGPDVAARERRPHDPPNYEGTLTHDQRLGLLVSVSSRGLDEPISVRVLPKYREAFEPARKILRDWARRQRPESVLSDDERQAADI